MTKLTRPTSSWFWARPNIADALRRCSKRRLNHALFLYRQGLAPRILTTGGKGGDPRFTEGEVARAYLSKHDIPSEAILVESEGESTVYSTAAAAEIMRRMNLKSCIVVSDGYHIYRVKKMLESQGMSVYGSPRPEVQQRLAPAMAILPSGDRLRLLANRHSDLRINTAAAPPAPCPESATPTAKRKSAASTRSPVAAAPDHPAPRKSA